MRSPCQRAAFGEIGRSHARRRPWRCAIPAAFALLALCSARGWGQQRAALSDDEADRVREAQDPGERIEVYVDLAQDRLTRFSDFREKSHDPEYDNGGYLDKLLGQYVALQDEMKEWIDDQYQRNGDMRKGLRDLLAKGPQQLAELRHIRETPDSYASDYAGTLRDAIDDLTDALDGATRALADQEKKFAEQKREEKASAQEAKETAKEAKKREKEEEKLRKKEGKLQRKQGVPEDPDQQN